MCSRLILRLSCKRVGTKRPLTTEHVGEHDFFPHSHVRVLRTGSILVGDFDTLLYAEASGLIRSDT